MKIYHAPRSRSLRVIWAAEELGLAYETESASIARPSEAFLELNPAGTLPAFVDDDVRMNESVAIIQYLAEKHGPTPLAPPPGDPRRPAYLNFLVYGEATLAGPLNALIGTRFLAPDDQKQNWTIDFVGKSYERRLRPVLRQLEKGPYMTGDEFTLADISVGYAFGIAELLQLCEHPAPIQAYRERLAARPAFQRASAVA